MRVNPLRVEQAPNYLHFTYSLCIHAAALALLVALPVVGVSGAPPGGGYVVALTDKVKQPLKRGALGKTNVRPAGAGVNTVGHKPVPVPIASNTAGPSAKAPRVEETAKPLLTKVRSESLHIGNAGRARKADAQTKREPPAKNATSETVKPAQSVASPIQEKPSLRPDVSAVLPDPELESVAAMPQRETTPPASDRKIASSKNTIKAQGIADAGSSPNASGFSTEARGRGPVSQSHPTEKRSGPAASSLSREFGLFRGTGGVFGEPPLSQREDVSDKDMSDKGKKGTEEMPPLAIRVPEALLVREIKVEVVGDKKALSDISMGLTIRAHPANRRKHVRDAERKIEETEIAINSDDSRASAIKTFSLRKAEQGVYIFSLTNAGKATSVAVVFHLYAGSEHRRMKEYDSFSLPASTVAKFMFLMPEALFWDDTDSFSGIIEDSRSVTKFRYETELIWKEVKE